MVNSLVIIDSRVEDAKTLIEGIHDGEVLLLDSHKDGVEQITHALNQRKVSKLHLVCHGSPGNLQLGTTNLNIDSLESYAQSITGWLAEEASIILYGCQVAAGKIGNSFLKRLHQLTRASLAASSHKVGNHSRGGSWDLDYQIGVPCGDDLVFSREVREAYGGIFASEVSFSTSPEVLVETEGTVLTFNFTTTGDLPVRVFVSSDTPQALNQLALFSLSFTGGENPVGDFDFTGFAYTITEPNATISIPVFLDTDVEGAQEINFFLLEPSQIDPIDLQEVGSVGDYTVANSSGRVIIADTAADIPSEPTPEPPTEPTPEPPTEPTPEEEVTVGIVANPTSIVEEDSSTITFNLSEAPPPEGITVTLDSTIANSLNDFNLANATATGLSFAGVNEDNSGFNVNITQQTASLTFSAIDDGIEEGSEAITYSLVDGENYDVDGSAGTVTLTIEDPEIVLPPPPTDINFNSDSDIFTFTSDQNIRLTLNSVGADNINGIGIYNPAQGQTITNIINNGQSVFTTLDSSTFDLLSSQNITNSLSTVLTGFSSGDEIAFYFVNNGTAESLLVGEPSESGIVLGNIEASNQGNGFLVTFGENTDVQVSLEITDETPPVGVNSQGNAIIDLTGLDGTQQAQFNLSPFGDSAFNNIGGLYRIENAQGAVLGANDELINPEEDGYTQAALNRVVGTQVGEFSSESVTLDGSFSYTPFVLANGEVFYSAFFSPDGFNHIVELGDNTYGFEDLPNLGDADFNDYIFSVDATII